MGVDPLEAGTNEQVEAGTKGRDSLMAFASGSPRGSGDERLAGWSTDIPGGHSFSCSNWQPQSPLRPVPEQTSVLGGPKYT